MLHLIALHVDEDIMVIETCDPACVGLMSAIFCHVAFLGKLFIQYLATENTSASLVM